MKIRLGQLRLNIRRLLEFGVDDTLRNDAGFFMGGGNSGSNKGVTQPPPGLGPDNQDEEEIENSSGEEQEKSQPAVRVATRAGYAG